VYIKEQNQDDELLDLLEGSEVKQEMKDVKEMIKDEKELLEIETFERIMDTCDTIVKIDDRIVLLSHEDRHGVLDREAFCELLMLRAMSRFPRDFRDLELKHVKFAMANMGKLYIITAIRTYDADQLGRHELQQICNSSIIEESQLVYQAILMLDKWYQQAGLGRYFKTNTTGDFPIDLDMITSLWPSLAEFLDSAKTCLSGSIGGRKRKAKTSGDRSSVRSAIKQTLKCMGLEFTRSPSRRGHMYGIFPSEEIEFLVPKIEFKSIDPNRVDSDVLRESVRRMELTYEKFQKLEPNQQPVGRKKSVAAIDRPVRRRCK
jgi:hypothetical protein